MSAFDKTELSRLNYGVVLNDLTGLNHDEKFELGDWILRKALPDEIFNFRQDLVKFSLTGYAHDVPRQEIFKTPSGDGFHIHKIPSPKHWRYMIVEPKSADSLPSYKLSEALRISDWDIWVEWWCVKQNFGGTPRNICGGSPFHCLRFLTDMERVVVSNKSCIKRLNRILNYRKEFEDERFPAISKALKMFRDQDVNRESPLKHLGYFSIIESILSHAPKQNDSADTISKQLKRNLILLDNRMDKDYNLHIDGFNGTSKNKLIGKLYSYRSSIAHGNNSEKDIKWIFDNRPNLENEYKHLNSFMFIGLYLRMIVQRVLVQAIIEPQLITDLKG